MAYRKLEFGDHVRICNPSSPHHGYNAVVIDETDGGMNKVQINHGHFGELTTVTFWLNSKHLLVRDDAFNFIVDGKIDHEAKAKAEADAHVRRKESDRNWDYYDDPDEDDDLPEPCGTCSCCEAHYRM